MTLDSDKDFRAVIHSTNPGQTTIKLRVEVSGDKPSTRYTQLEDEAQIQVYDKLEILQPQGGKLLIPYNTNTRIKTNRYSYKGFIY